MPAGYGYKIPQKRCVLMKIECNDIVVFKTPDSVFKSRVSKVDGNVIKLFEEDGSYRQMARRDLVQMVEKGFARINPVNNGDEGHDFKAQPLSE
jgi:hypothetical protein